MLNVPDRSPSDHHTFYHCCLCVGYCCHCYCLEVVDSCHRRLWEKSATKTCKLVKGLGKIFKAYNKRCSLKGSML